MTTTPIIVTAPASKSMSHRTLIAAALANGVSRLSSVLNSDDIQRTQTCLTACGAHITSKGTDILVSGMKHGPQGGKHNETTEPPKQHHLYMHESGTTCRLMTAVAAAGHGLFHIDGAPRMQERPLGELLEALSQLGTEFDFKKKSGHLPLDMKANGYTQSKVHISLEESSQYLSGLLLGAPLANHEITISVKGKKAISWPYVALTLQVMEDFKAKFSVMIEKDGEWIPVPWRTVKEVTPGKIRFVVQPSGYEATDYQVEGDWSNASYFLAAGALGERPVMTKGLATNSLQGDRVILDILSQMGAAVDVTYQGILISPRPLRGITVDMGRCPDLVPTVAALAAFAKTPTRIENIAHLRIKETDRLAACAHEIARTGALTEARDDTLIIRPTRLPKGKTLAFKTYNDHRMAMSLSLFQFAQAKVELDNPSCVNKSFPTFFDVWGNITSSLIPTQS